MASVRQKVGWPGLLENAESSDPQLRQLALIRSYAWTEGALNAAGVAKRGSTASRILSTLHETAWTRGLEEMEVRHAIGLRHEGAHLDEVGTPKECVAAVSVFWLVCKTLSMRFVNLRNAALVANRIAARSNVEAVLLYGSLARGGADANDIDFLVLDDGTYSRKRKPVSYDSGAPDPGAATIDVLKLLGLDDSNLRLCATSRWLDVNVVDGTRFGTDDVYTAAVKKAQTDPWFFLNISADALEYDLRGNAFRPTTRKPFVELARLHQELASLGFA